MNIDEVKAIAKRISELGCEGVLSIYKDAINGKPRVHLNDERFEEFSEGRDVETVEHGESFNEEHFEEDGVVFFHLVLKDE